MRIPIKARFSIFMKTYIYVKERGLGTGTEKALCIECAERGKLAGRSANSRQGFIFVSEVRITRISGGPVASQREYDKVLCL